MKYFFLLIIIGLSLLSIPLQAEIYKWSDQEGNTYFSDRADGENAEKITPKVIQPPSQTGDQKRVDKPATKEPEAPAEPKTVLDKQKEEITQACEKYRKNLTMLQEPSKRIYTLDEEGNYHYLTEEDRQSQIELTQKKIDSLCEPVKAKSKK